MPKPFDPEQLEAFISDRRVAVLATAGAGGAPSMMPVWYLYENGEFIVRTGANSVKARHIRRNPAVALLVQEERPPYAYATAYARATVEPDIAGLDRTIAERYLGGFADAYLQSADAHVEEVVLRLRPERIVSSNFGADFPSMDRFWFRKKE